MAKKRIDFNKQYDWSDNGDRLELWVYTKNLPADIIKYGKYDFMNGVVDKVNEEDPVSLVNNHHNENRVRPNRYDLNRGYRVKVNRTRKFANARKAKAIRDNEMMYISTGFSAPWGTYTKETTIHDTKLWKPFNKENQKRKIDLLAMEWQ